MRVSVLSFQSGKLLRGVALGLIAGLGAGCSSDFSRFAPTSADYTGSINQQQIINKSRPVAQPFPDDVSSANSAQYEEPTYTGSIENGSIRPVASNIKRSVLAPVAPAGSRVVASANRAKNSALAPVSAARRAVTEEPMPMPASPPKKQALKHLPIADGLDETVTGSVQPKVKHFVTGAQPVQQTALTKPRIAKSGTEHDQATWIIVKPGETVSNLAVRFGVPSSAILEANNLPDAMSLQAGAKIIIPASAHSNTAKNTVREADTENQLAKSTATDSGEGKSPLPKKSPARENVAVIPATTKLKEKQVAATTDGASKLKIIKSSDGSATTPKGVKPAEVAAEKTSRTASGHGTYTVASGDSLYVIAKKNGTTVERLKSANGIVDGKLKIGQVLKVPAIGEVAVAQANQGVDPIITGSAATAAKKPTAATAPDKAEPVAAPSTAVMDEADKDTSAAPSATGISKLRWPVRGRTLVGYGQADAGRTNDGVDISVPVGTPVKAAENGVVIYAGTGLKDFGNTVLIRHENGLVTVYGHNGDLMVKRGETIKRGQEIARSGMSGNTKVPKLHFEVRKNSKPVNPTSFLE